MKQFFTYGDKMEIINKVLGMMGKSEYYEFLTRPEQVLEINFPVKTSKGLRIFQGFRVKHSTVLGPAKGGIRYHQDVDVGEVKTLAFLMTWKNSLMGLPYGGGKGGIRFNPKEYTEEDIERITRAFAKRIMKFIGPDIDVPAPDVYTNPQIMGYILDEYINYNGWQPATITGKPLSIGGIIGRSESTARGAYFIIKELLREEKDPTIIIQGFGNAGMNLAKMLYEDGYKIIGISDSKGGVYNEEGLNIDEIITKKREGTLKRNITNKDLLVKKTTLLIPAALGNQITDENAGGITAKYVVEVANNPISHSADEILTRKGITIVPDILANSGGVIGSYFEWVQNREGRIWKYEKFINELKDIILERYNLVKKLSEDKHITLREAAYYIAVERVLTGAKDRGLI